jgi:hypothetical protein
MDLQNSSYRVFAVGALLAGVVLLSVACRKHSAASTTAASRTYRMGFSLSAPRPDINEIIQSLDIWTSHADAAIISTEVPWDSLIGGENPVTYVINNYGSVVNIYRTANLKIWVYIDPENGLNRQSDSDPLVALGKSIAQPDVQMLYRQFVVAMDSIIHPDHLGLALETNLIRYAAPDSIYQGVKQAANTAAADVRAIDTQVPLSISASIIILNWFLDIPCPSLFPKAVGLPRTCPLIPSKAAPLNSRHTSGGKPRCCRKQKGRHFFN